MTTLGSGVDGSVMKRTIGYDGQGNASVFTSYNASNTIVNQVVCEYNAASQMDTLRVVLPDGVQETKYIYLFGFVSQVVYKLVGHFLVGPTPRDEYPRWFKCGIQRTGVAKVADDFSDPALAALAAQ